MKIEEMIAARSADCSGCEACANICPKNAIKMTRDTEGFAYPKISPELCINCGRCDVTCPALNFKRREIFSLPQTFVAIYDDDKILRHSSSGAVFTALSEIILNNKGVVFGAGFDKNWHVVHTAARNFNELENLRGSKYTQSQIRDIYRQVKAALEFKQLRGGGVLFSGTPCQCAGLKHFLGQDYDNLLTVDIICHGTPSPALWEYYIEELAHRNDIAHVNFRSKRNGWGSDIEINYSDRGHYIRQNNRNLYGKLFLIGLTERPSCSSCKFKIPYSQSDLTIGDAWGVKNFAPEMFDSRGVSIVFIHTTKGKKFFEQANLKTQRVNFRNVVAHNLSSIIAGNADSRRKDFFADFAKNADKFVVMEKYYYQEDAAIRKETLRKNRSAFNANLHDILEKIRQHFRQNILIVINPKEGATQKRLEDYFERNFKDSGIYFLHGDKDGKLNCKEHFSAIDFNFKNVAELNDFVKRFKFAMIGIENPLNWRSEFFLKWLGNSGLPLRTFARNPN